MFVILTFIFKCKYDKILYRSLHMKYIIVMVIAFISAIVSYTTLDKKIANKLKIYQKSNMRI